MSEAGSLTDLHDATGDPAYYLELFLDEGREGLERLRVWLGSLAGRLEDRELIAEAFRVLHGFKGMADTLAFHDLVAVAHALEEVLDGLRWGRGEATVEGMAAMQEQVRWLQSRLMAIADGAAPQGAQGVQERVALLKALTGHFAPPGQGRWEQALPVVVQAPLLRHGARRWAVRLLLDEHCFMKAARALLATTALESLGAVLDVTPSLEELEWSDGGDGFTIVLATDHPEEAIREVVSSLSEVTLAQTTALDPAPPVVVAASEGERVQAALATGAQARWVAVALNPGTPQRGARAAMCVEMLASQAEVLRTEPDPSTLWEDPNAHGFRVLILGAFEPESLRERLMMVAEVQAVELSPYQDEARLPMGPQEALPLPAEAFPPPAPEAPSGLPPLPKAPPQAQAKARPRRSVRVDAEALAGLVRRAQSLADALALSGKGQDQAQEARSLAAALAALNQVPLSQVLQGLSRNAQDLAQDLGKRLRFELQGGEVHAPRALADELVDLLGHLIRNAVDHGLESPGEREALGKNPVGLVRVVAEREVCGALVLSLSDDGRGIDPEPLWARAVARGFLGADDAEALRELDPLAVLTLPGFTSRDEATRHSGRGVGLDVVKRRSEDWGGSLVVSTEAGRGTSFRLRWPGL